jgi:uncharacterized protein
MIGAARTKFNPVVELPMKQPLTKRGQRGQIWLGRLPHGADLLDALTAVCRAHRIRLGRVEALGALQRARLGFYDQRKRVYEFLELKKPLELLQLVGNISLKDGQPFVHAHVTLADESGKAFGGHLAPGTIVFACEFVLEAFRGPALAREPDAETGLALWPATRAGRSQRKRT